MKRIREKNGITQQEVSFSAKIDRTYVSMLERGLRQPSLQVIFDLSDALGITPEDLISQTSKLYVDLSVK
ncbi:MAG: helix-turn-helix transcriptional regulator [Agarilytica sp.]